MSDVEQTANASILAALQKLDETKGPGYTEGLVDGINLIPTAQETK
jgi:hypothetical protein